MAQQSLARKGARTQFVCQDCGQASPKWLGRCPACGTWSSLVEEAVVPAAAAAGPGGVALGLPATVAKAQRLSEVAASTEARISCGMAELDRVLGGGLVRGSLVLVGGDPGIGKSTLLLQIFGALGKAGHKVLYVTGEESVQQVKMRAERLGTPAKNLWVLAETRFEAVEAAFAEHRPEILVVDSIQTVGLSALDGAVGSVGQIRQVTQRLMVLAKTHGAATFVVGHVTKEGTLAGPKVMEHMVDTVLYFEGERAGPYRLLRAHKNRFGSVQEMGVFEMGARGLVPVQNPSALFLSQRACGPGACVVSSLEGSRPILLEVQALVTPTYAGGSPRRTTTGFDPQRTAMLCAVLAARTSINLAQADVFVNVAGGVRLSEPAADLGVALALASAAKQRPIDADVLVVGEVGLAGEVRAAQQLGPRLTEAAALGFGRALVPRIDSQRLTGRPALPVVGVPSLADALAEVRLV